MMIRFLMPAHHPRRLARVALMATTGALLLLAVAVVPANAQEPTGASPTPEAGSREPETYTVQPRDTLALIAVRTGVPIGDLVAFNAIEDPDVIEVGAVLFLEPVPVPPPPPEPNVERSIVSREPEDRSLGTRLSEWWDGLYRPDLNLSDRSLSQGAVAGLMLPAAVLTFVALWLGWQGLRRAAIAVGSVGGRAVAVAGPRMGSGGGGATTAPPTPSVAARDGAADPSWWRRASSRVALPAWRPSAPARRPSVSLRRPSWDLSGLRDRMGMLLASAAGAVRGLVRTPAVISRAIEARRERAAELSARQEAQAYWLTGTERLRIGLADEAYASFDAALRIAREHGWTDEIERNLAALDDVAALRQEEETGGSTESPPDA